LRVKVWLGFVYFPAWMTLNILNFRQNMSTYINILCIGVRWIKIISCNPTLQKLQIKLCIAVTRPSSCPPSSWSF
jgi:hypothetical protein